MIPVVKKGLICIFYLSALLFHVKGYAQQATNFKSHGRVISIKSFNLDMEIMMRDFGIPSASIAIIDEGNVSYSNVYGFKRVGNKEFADRNTVFEACSLSKIFLAYAAYQMIEKGQLELDKPLYKYFRNYTPLMHDRRYKAITARMVLNHTSGIENWKKENNPEKLEILDTPGKRFIYSGEGFIFLTRVMESILNESFYDFTNRMVIKPLALRNTYMRVVAPHKNQVPVAYTLNYAYGYDIFGGEIIKATNYDVTTLPASYMHTTAEDFAKLVLAFFDKSSFSKTTERELLQSGILLENLGKFSVYSGPGFGTIKFPSEELVYFTGDNDGFKSAVFYSVTEKRGFVIFTNSDFGKKLMAGVNRLTTNFDLDLENSGDSMYPSMALFLFRVFREEGEEAMLNRISYFKVRGELQPADIEELSSMFYWKKRELSDKILKLK